MSKNTDGRKMAVVADNLLVDNVNRPGRSLSVGASPRKKANRSSQNKRPSNAPPGDLGRYIQNGGDGINSPSADLEEFVGHKIELIKGTQKLFRRAALLGGFVPDYILSDEILQVPSLRQFEAVVFMTDISGFTALTEEYSLKGKGGTDQLTKTLAAYMGPLAENILRTGGDIIKFAGDAFLSVWEVKNQSEYPELIQQVVDTALYCQEKQGQYVTDVGIVIKVKIGIGAGVCYAAGLGDAIYNHYAVFGPGVKAASAGEHECISGDIVIHPSAWKHCDPKHFSYLDKGDGFVKVLDILHFTNPTKRGRPVLAARLNKKMSNNYNDAIRPALDQAITATAEHRLKKYVIAPVLRKLEDEIPLEYLNESRMVSIVFIHVDYIPFEANSATEYQNLAEIVQIAFLKILDEASKLNGCLTKVIMFDKGLTYLVVFGLPGYTQDSQTANALNCAYRCHRSLGVIDGVKECSIGVTTGSTYCGILGHPRRHEYTVIGKKVNKAARLMCYYPGKVTCEQETFYNSKLPLHYFLLLETKALKGISNVGKIYEFLSSDVGDVNTIRKYDFPMLNRKNEVALIKDTMEACRNEFLKTVSVPTRPYDTRSATDMTSSGAWMMVIEGENGIGKTRLLSSIMHDAEKMGWKVFACVLTQKHVSNPVSQLFAVKSLMMQVFNMDGLRTAAEREEHIRKMAITSGDQDIIQGICTLNELLSFKLPVPQKIAYADAKVRHSFTQHTLVQLIKLFHPQSMLLLCVEDAHYMQQLSWEYLNFISRLPSVVTLMTLRRNSDGSPKLPEVAYKICYHSPHVKTIMLQGMESQYMLPLACQLLEVKAIPADLERILMNKSLGNPSWVENILNELLNLEKIKVVDVEGDKVPKKDRVIFVNPKLITRQDSIVSSAFQSKNYDEDAEFEPSDITPAVARTRVNPENRLCLIKSNERITAGNISGNTKEMILDVFDKLNPNDQMMVKCACVLGGRFSHIMLNRLLPLYGRDAKKYMASFRKLMEDRIIRCATPLPASKRQKTSIKPGGVTDKIQCNCPEERFDDSIDNVADSYSTAELPSYCYCRYSEFTKEPMVDVIYELMTEDLKKELHLKAAKYLETTAVLCVSCGGEGTTFVYGFEVDDMVAAEGEEEAIAVAGAGTRKRSNRLRTPKISLKNVASKRSRGKPSPSASKTSDRENRTEKKGSLASQIRTLRLSLGSTGGGQIASIELDIMKSLYEYEQRRKSVIFRCSICQRRNNNVDEDIQDAIDNEMTSSTIINEKGDGVTFSDKGTNVDPKPTAADGDATKPRNAEPAKPSPATSNSNPSAIISSPENQSQNQNQSLSNTKEVTEQKIKKKSKKNKDAEEGSKDKSQEKVPKPRARKRSMKTDSRSSQKPGVKPSRRKMSFSAPDNMRTTVLARGIGGSNQASSDNYWEDADSVEDSVPDMYDLRDCQCAMIEARICIELIAHYRMAEKYGKCLNYLLDAAESVLALGSAGQAMNYLDEAADVVQKFENGTYVADDGDPDDVVLVQKEVNTQMAFLSGLAYFERGTMLKAKLCFLDTLKLLNTSLPNDDNHRKIRMAIRVHNYSLWQKYHAPACCRRPTKFKKGDKKAAMFAMKIRCLSYLQKLYRSENKVSMALLVSLIQTAVAEELGGHMHEEIPAYCNMMDMMTHTAKHEKAKFYERKSLNLIRQNFGSEEQVDPLGLFTSANLFLTLASVRCIRGELITSIEAAYISLRIAKVLHDETLTIHLYPVLIMSLMFTLRITEAMEAMHNLWYTSQAQDNWSGTATYFHLSMELILELCCPIESFYYCEQFVTGRDWTEDVALFREFEIQYSFESSLALWYSRFSKWDEAKLWRNRAEQHRPPGVSVRSVGGTLKLLQCYLISANYHQTKKRYQLFANDRNRAKQLMKELKKDIVILPIYQARYHHLVAYYYKILDRKKETNRKLVQATEIAKLQGNRLEEEYVKHSRIVWAEMATPNVKYYWLENSEQKNNNIDWHAMSKIPWQNIMYSMPVPAWT